MSNKPRPPPTAPSEFKDPSGLSRERLYGPANVTRADDIAAPGPTIHARTSRHRLTAGGCGRCASTSGFGTRRRVEPALPLSARAGTTGLSVAFERSTQIGYDSDDPHSMGEVGKVACIDSLEDMEGLFDQSRGQGLDLDDDQRDSHTLFAL